MTIQDKRRKAAALLKEKGAMLAEFPALVGFDGFVDEIIRVVDKRSSTESYSTMSQMSAFAERIHKAAGKSTNIELIVQETKLGGNGPIMANALSRLSVPVTYIGCLGFPNLHPVFRDFSTNAQVYSISEPGSTDALEFDDGKIMLGKHNALRDVTYENIIARIGAETFQKIWDASRFLGIVNWTMLVRMTDIWKRLLSVHCGNVDRSENRVVFFDLADPEKRDFDDIAECLTVISKFSRQYKVILGCNEKESLELAKVLEINVQDLETRAALMREKLAIDLCVIHPVKFAVAASASETAHVDGRFVESPKISTGAGDHFNAGFCIAELLDGDLESALLTGVSTSGFYVRNAASPTLQDLAVFLNEWKD